LYKQLYPGFESLSLRQFKQIKAQKVPFSAIWASFLGKFRKLSLCEVALAPFYYFCGSGVFTFHHPLAIRPSMRPYTLPIFQSRVSIEATAYFPLSKAVRQSKRSHISHFTKLRFR
jgi:hypothetical protein